MDNKFPIVLTIVIGATISCIAWAISWGYVNSWKTVTEQGYIQQQMQGSQSTVWVKPTTQPTK